MTVCLLHCLRLRIGWVDETMTHPCSKSQVHAIRITKDLPIFFSTLKITLANHSPFVMSYVNVNTFKKQNPLQPIEIYSGAKVDLSFSYIGRKVRIRVKTLAWMFLLQKRANKQ